MRLSRSYVPAVLLSILVLFTIGCSSAYQPLNGNQYGYSEQQLSPGTYLVEYVANNAITPADANMMAIYRAAELAKQHGFTYFTIVKTDTALHSSRLDNARWSILSPPTTYQSSISGGNTVFGIVRVQEIPQARAGYSSSYVKPYDNRYRALVTVELLKTPKGTHTYEAQQVLNALAPIAGKKVVL